MVRGRPGQVKSDSVDIALHFQVICGVPVAITAREGVYIIIQLPFSTRSTTATREAYLTVLRDHESQSSSSHAFLTTSYLKLAPHITWSGQSQPQPQLRPHFTTTGFPSRHFATIRKSTQIRYKRITRLDYKTKPSNNTTGAFHLSHTTARYQNC